MLTSNPFKYLFSRNSQQPPSAEEEAVLRASSVPLYEKQAERWEALKVQPGSFAPRRALYELGASAGTALGEVGGVAIAAGAVTWVASKMAADGSSLSQQGVAHAAAVSLTTAITGLVQKAVKVITSVRLTEVSALEETFKALRADITPEFLAQFPEGVVKAVKLIFDDVERKITEAKTYPQTLTASYLEKNLRHLLLLLSRPLHTQKLIGASLSAEQETSISKGIDKLVAGYPSRNKSVIECLIQSIRINSVTTTPSRVQAYLYGPAGTGKTRFARELANLLGLPFILIKFPANGLDAVLGSQHYHAREYNTSPPDTKLIGELLLKMIKSGIANPIILIDEIEITSENLSALKLLLDSIKESLPIGGYPSADLDWKHATILMASNQPLKDEALQTRVPQIIFDKIPEHIKKEVSITTALNAFNTYREISNPRGVLPDVCGLGRFKEKILDMIDFLVKKDTEEYEGVRFLEYASEQMVNFISADLRHNAIPKTVKQIMSYIYAQAKGKPDVGEAVLEAKNPLLTRHVVLESS
jgi:hypothetical protein